MPCPLHFFLSISSGGTPRSSMLTPRGISALAVAARTIAQSIRISFMALGVEGGMLTSRCNFTRISLCNIVKRCIAGDRSLITVVGSNPITPTSAIPVQVQVNQKRQLDRDDALFDIEVAERRLKLSTIASEAQSKAVDVQMKMIEVQKMLMESYTSLYINKYQSIIFTNSETVCFMHI